MKMRELPVPITNPATQIVFIPLRSAVVTSMTLYCTISLNSFCHMSQGPTNGEFLVHVTGHQPGWRIAPPALMGASGRRAVARTIYGNFAVHFASYHRSQTRMANLEIRLAVSQVTGPGELSEMVQYARSAPRERAELWHQQLSKRLENSAMLARTIQMALREATTFPKRLMYTASLPATSIEVGAAELAESCTSDRCASGHAW